MATFAPTKMQPFLFEQALHLFRQFKQLAALLHNLHCANECLHVQNGFAPTFGSAISSPYKSVWAKLKASVKFDPESSARRIRVDYEPQAILTSMGFMLG